MAEGAPLVATWFWSEEGCESLLDLVATSQPGSLGDTLAAEFTVAESRAAFEVWAGPGNGEGFCGTGIDP